jgi:D-galactose 1-dehydrogenase
MKIAVVGLGQIARKQHLPSIAASPDFTLAGLASADAPPPEGGMPVYTSHTDLLAAVPEIEAVAICTPPAFRFAVACDALLAGKHVLLEKPPGLGVAEVDALARLAERQGRTLFTAWHSQFNTAVDRARDFLAGRTVATLRIDWNEDFRKYHPGQDWIWRSGGFGVFDMGINGLSILSRLFATPPFLREAEFQIAANHEAPLAASLRFASLDSDGAMEAHFDWRGDRPEQREIRLTTTDGHSVTLLQSGGRLLIDDVEVVGETRREYPMLYTRFADLIRTGRSEIDTMPLQMTAEAFLMARHVGVPAFDS